MVKVLVVGWDGADKGHLERIEPDYYSSLSYGGRLLPEKVYRGIPIDSGTAWTTITTGLEVEEHGFLSINNVVESRKLLGLTKRFTKHVPLKKLRTYMFYGPNKLFNLKERTPRSHDVEYKRLWDYVEGETLTLGVPLTYPAWKHNGVMFSGIPAPMDGELPSSYPESYEKYRERYNGYYYLDSKKTPLEERSQPNLEEYREKIYEYNEEAFKVIEELDGEEFELVFAVFPIIDDLLHALDEEDDWNGIREAYRWLDNRTKELVEKVGPDHVLILSDHGMMPEEESLNPNSYPGLEMDHDPMNGVWASDTDLGLEEQRDVTPKLLELLGTEFRRERLDMETGEEDRFEDIEV